MQLLLVALCVTVPINAASRAHHCVGARASRESALLTPTNYFKGVSRLASTPISLLAHSQMDPASHESLLAMPLGHLEPAGPTAAAPTVAPLQGESEGGDVANCAARPAGAVCTKLASCNNAAGHRGRCVGWRKSSAAGLSTTPSMAVVDVVAAPAAPLGTPPPTLASVLGAGATTAARGARRRGRGRREGTPLRKRES